MSDRLKEKLLSMVGEIHPEDGDPDVIRRQNRSGKHVKDRKIHALCKQIEIALSMAMPADLDLIPMAVTPGADPSHVIAIFQRTDEDIDLRAATERLESLNGYFRAEIAKSISRKRVPALILRVSPKVLYE